jgi:hypothetical protein
LIKQLFSPSSPGVLESAERQFAQELNNGITAVNAFFVEKERQMVSALSLHDDTCASSSSTEERASFFKEVSELHAFCVLNYLAVLKIVKKHDKYSQKLVRQRVVEQIFSQAFYLSLEHSYLYTACRAYLSEHPLPASSILRGISLSNGGGGGGQRGTPDETLEVPAHFERCLMGDGLSVGRSYTPIDFATLRRTDAKGTSRTVEMQIECLLQLAGVQSCGAGGSRGCSQQGSYKIPGAAPFAGRAVHSPEPVRPNPSGEWGVSPTICSTSAPSMPLPCATPGALFSAPEGMEEMGCEWAETLFVASRRARNAESPLTTPPRVAMHENPQAFWPLSCDSSAFARPTGDPATEGSLDAPTAGAAARPRATSATPGATVTKLTACGATVSMSDDEGVFQIE